MTNESLNYELMLEESKLSKYVEEALAMFYWTEVLMLKREP